MAVDLGSYGPAAFGGEQVPRPAAVVMGYTGHTRYTESDPPVSYTHLDVYKRQHLAIGERLDGKSVTWMEQVSDEQYNAR